jgi:hypothetical protein
MAVQVREVQKSHLGQALVHFWRVQDRDRMVIEGPFPYDNVNLSFVKHNQGRNRRRVYFNRECWLMLLGFPMDYWEEEYLDTVVGPFGRVIS